MSRDMAGNCSACRHPDRATLDKALAHGETLRECAKRFGVSKSALERHRSAHLGISMGSTIGTDAKRAAVHAAVSGALAGQALVHEVRALRDKASALGLQAESSGDTRTALLAVRELTRLVELQGRLTLEASAGRASDLVAHPVFHDLVGLVLVALDAYPDARRAVESAIRTRLGAHASPVTLVAPDSPGQSST